MSLEPLTAILLTYCLAIFFLVNLINLARTSRSRKRTKAYAEVKRPTGVFLGIAALGTVVYFIEAFIYSLLVFTNQINILQNTLLQLHFPYDVYVQFFGLILTVAGCLLFIWSVIARGKYATSWEMLEKHKLVTWGPYRYIRHPSYLGYFLMFFGLFLIWLNLVAIFPLFAILGYIQITEKEEELLIERFGDKYRRYQKQTGKFFPKLRK